MALLGAGVAAIWHDIGADAEDDYHHWHCHEHIPERLAVPGFLRGRRYVGVSGQPAFFHFYETQSLATLTSPAYLERLNNPTPWTSRVIPNFRNANRTLSQVICTHGLGGGAAIMTLQLSAQHSAELEDWLCRQLFPDLTARRGIVGAHLLRGDEAASHTPTEEKSMRNKPDEVSAWVVLIEALQASYLEALRAAELADSELRANGVSGCNAGIYRLHFTLTAAEVVAAS